ncbi:MAG: hypothetical protein HY776_04005 [Actinobacteria bacterium]|nr:hypothetical protein [Actinomycetota bacterium]
MIPINKLLKNFKAKPIFLLLIFVLLLIIVNGCKTKGASSDSEEKTTKTQPPKKVYGKINEEVKIGKVRWKVIELRKIQSIDRIAGGPLTPRGVFLILKIEAISEIGKTFPTSVNNFTVQGVGSRQTTSQEDVQNALMQSKDYQGTLLFKKLKINEKLTGWIGFDIPTTLTGLKLRIKDPQPFSSTFGIIDLGV